MSLWAYICEPGWEDRLTDELSRVFPGHQHATVAPGWVAGELSADKPSTVPSVALAAQCLPRAVPIEARSIAAWVQESGQRLMDGLANHSGPWRLHVFAVYRPDGPVGPRRCELIEAGIRELLAKKQRRLLRTTQPADRPWGEGEALAQIGLTAAGHGFFSLCEPELRHCLRRTISRFPGGAVEVPPDRFAPSRAFAKLRAAEIHLGQEIAAGQTCVDLGSSPGSWAYLALQRGARVVAIDRSPLRDDLMANPALSFIRGDAFGFQPAESVDWLLCDVVARPERIIELLQQWIERHSCRRFCVTVKFQGTEDYAKLDPLKLWLDAAGVEFTLRRLTHNKNEVTAMGTVTPRNDE